MYDMLVVYSRPNFIENHLISTKRLSWIVIKNLLGYNLMAINMNFSYSVYVLNIVMNFVIISVHNFDDNGMYDLYI